MGTQDYRQSLQPRPWDIIPADEGIFVVTETVFPKPIMGITSFPVGTTLVQVVKTVFRAHLEAEPGFYYYKGEKFKGDDPSKWHKFMESILPGTQITKHPTKKRYYMMVGQSIKNGLTLLSKFADWQPEWTCKEHVFNSTPVFMPDPIPEVSLYENPMADFSMIPGKLLPTSVAVYNQKTKELRFLNPIDKDRVIREFSETRKWDLDAFY